jgi:hypothetical protein
VRIARIEPVVANINHLKGEQGKPSVKANKTAPVGTSKHSSETERKLSRKRHPSSKKAKLEISCKEEVKVRAEELPAVCGKDNGIQYFVRKVG